MNFASKIALKNISRRPSRSAAMALLVMFLAFTLFAGAFSITSLRRGLDSYRARLGADVVVVPGSTRGHGTVDDVLLQGITGNYYMSGKDCDKVAEIEGVAAVSRQFFLTSAKASCCSSRVQIIGFDPESDFSVLPWISSEYSGEIGDGDLVVGSSINVPADKKIKFYGNYYNVKAQLSSTGTGLDSAVYVNMPTMEQMAQSASNLFGSEMFEGVDVNNGASALMIKVADGYEPSDVADRINIQMTRVEATASRAMIADISDGLGKVSGIIGALVAAIWVLAVVILVIAFSALTGERRKELAVLRVMGASRKMLSRIMSTEAAVVSAVGAVIGVALGMLVVFPAAGSLRSSLELPLLLPGAAGTALLAVGVIIVSVAAGLLASYVSAHKITGNETALLLREDG